MHGSPDITDLFQHFFYISKAQAKNGEQVMYDAHKQEKFSALIKWW